ncbi:hypothetical protein T4B_13496 [Trichinella pseudospiralis]|uniref:Uncharacterized protein n=1 Tax=Trichinella pseudospiralis TaxID=6337 RepID=A0A0V1ERJ9_TRIPS|nr:hypothetical protein T4A_3810 [Trichinella pseudospiralis]KRZ27024.1 hypothetical protein T4B_13496 [Trichinella pseudospiralis]
MLRSSEPNREREAATCGEPMVRKEMFEANSIPAEKLAASKTILKIMLQDLNQMCEESEKAVVIQGQLSPYEALDGEEQQASMKEWSQYRLDFFRSQVWAYQVTGSFTSEV